MWQIEATGKERAACLFERRVGRERDIREQQKQKSRNARNK